VIQNNKIQIGTVPKNDSGCGRQKTVALWQGAIIPPPSEVYSLPKMFILFETVLPKIQNLGRNHTWGRENLGPK